MTIASPIELSAWPAHRLRNAGWERTARMAPLTLRPAGRRVVGRQDDLPPPHVAPFPSLEADLAVHADRFEPASLVQGHARVVRERDPGTGALEAPFAQE